MIEIRNMSFGYRKKRLFSGLDLTLQPGNIYGLLGKNGAGKTTLLKIISGLRQAQEGSCSRARLRSSPPACRYAGGDLLHPGGAVRAGPHSRRVRPLHAPLYPLFDRQAFGSYLSEFELAADKKLSELSYGQKKKFLIAFGLASRCRLLLMDEPTNGLDIPSKSQFRRLMARAGGTDQVILVSTHQVRDMENLIDPIIILDEGRIIFQQPLREVGTRLQASVESAEPADADALYAEKTLGGWAVLRREHGTGGVAHGPGDPVQRGDRGGRQGAGPIRGGGEMSGGTSGRSSDIRRFGRLLLRELAHGYRGLLIAMAAVAGGVIVISAIGALAASAGGAPVGTVIGDGYFGFFQALLFLGGFIVTSLAFREVWQNGSGLAYLMLPGSLFEKFLVKLLMTSVGFAAGYARIHERGSRGERSTGPAALRRRARILQSRSLPPRSRRSSVTWSSSPSSCWVRSGSASSRS